MGWRWAFWLGTGLVFLALAAGQAYLDNTLLSVGSVVVALAHFARAGWEHRMRPGGEDPSAPE